MRLEDVLRCLETKEVQFAREALENPPDKTAYGFGQSVGTVRGIRMAKEAIVAMHNDIEERKQRM